MNSDATLENIARYGYVPATSGGLRRGERLLFERLLRPGMSVLDLGCGGGRVTRALVRRALRVTACDLSAPAIDALTSSVPSSAHLEVAQADARSLPFTDRSFDAVVFAFNGIDYIHPEAGRIRAMRECERVLVPGGRFIFSSHNSLGALLTWRGAGCRRAWSSKVHNAVAGDFCKTYFREPDGLLLYHSTPRRVIRQVRENTRLELELVLGSSGIASSVPLLTVFSAWPYYVFRKQGD